MLVALHRGQRSTAQGLLDAELSWSGPTLAELEPLATRFEEACKARYRLRAQELLAQYGRPAR